jgi:hypothetical protein
VCIDCPTRRDRVNAVLRELTASLLLPVVLYAVPIGLLFAFGYIGT